MITGAINDMGKDMYKAIAVAQTKGHDVDPKSIALANRCLDSTVTTTTLKRCCVS